MLDDLIRAVLKEAAETCAVPENVDEAVWDRILSRSGPGMGGSADE